MPHVALPTRALAAAIVVLLTVGCIVAATGGANAESLALERATLIAAGAEPVVPAADGTATPATGTVDATDAQVLAAGDSAPPTTAPAPAPTTTSMVAATVPPPPTTVAPAAPRTTAAPPPPTTSPPTTSAPPAAAPTTTQAPAGTSRDSSCESSMLGWMNQTRAEHGIAPVTEDGGIQHISLDWSNEMARTGQLAHNPRYSDQIFAARPQAMTASEIVGWASSSARAVYDEFLRSPTHRDKILTRAFTHTTTACVRDGAGRVWVTVDFWG